VTSMNRSGLPDRGTASFGAKESIARAAEAGHYVSVVVEVTVHGRRIELDVPVGVVHLLDPLGGGDDRHDLNGPAASMLERVDAGDDGPSGSQHRVHDHRLPLRNIDRKLGV